jgi:death-on-curing protein
MQPQFLSVERILRIHRDQIDRYGGDPALRDRGLLDSAAAMPAASFGDQYLHAFPHEMAAAYLFHLTSNHPFVDGNKRIGLAAALIFLRLNGHRLVVDHTELEQMVLRVARSEIEKSDVAVFLRHHIQAIK